MNDKEEIKLSIIELIKKYESINLSYNEEMTKKDFILPLFRLLGWAIEDSNEVKAEEKISKKRVDYSFRINGIPKFFLEAKSLKEYLNNENFIEQAINYSWLKGCTWAGLTNFKEIKIYNAEWREALHHSHLMTINYKEFITRFDDLWLLSKESFQLGWLDKEAEKWGKKSKKFPIDQQLLKDFTYFREILSKDINKNNKNISQEDLDESVQRILDRLIFIRNCEDRELEPIRLSAIVREWQNNGKKVKGQLSNSLKQVFSEYKKIYNSKIFTSHLCDELTIDEGILEEIIEGLYYTKDKSIYYDFSAIEADVLGNIYEQYLGHILKKSAKRAKLTHSVSHRKEQGIYYTPSYIVDFIIKNTLGEILKDKKIKPDKIRILDPACGSGSFLIKAYDVLNDFWKKNNKDYDQGSINFEKLTFTKKEEILKNNIFGVDLDKQAVEIAQLNLFLKLAEKGRKLPLLNDNIKCGNSLIDDSNVAGDKAFKWNEEFSEILNEGGFDVIIGNPPWVSLKGKQKILDLSKEELSYLFNKYPCDKYRPNLFEMFIWKALSLLKDGGYLSFIVPDRLCFNEQFVNLRKFIIDNYSLKKLWFNPVFEGVVSDNVIFVIKKENPKNNNFVEIAKYPSLEFTKIRQNFYKTTTNFTWINNLDTELIKIFEKIKKDSNFFELGKKFNICTGFIAKFGTISNMQKNKHQKPILKGDCIKKYRILNYYYFDFNQENLIGGTKDINKLRKKNKVLIRKTGKDIISTFDNSGIFPEQSLYFIYSKNNESESELKTLCAILNSKLINCYYKNFAITNKDSTPQLKKIDLDKFPIIFPKNNQTLIKLVNKMLELNKRLLELENKKTDEREKILSEIKKTDTLIDKIVYEIYGITKEERQIIESNLD